MYRGYGNYGNQSYVNPGVSDLGMSHQQMEQAKYFGAFLQSEEGQKHQKELEAAYYEWYDYNVLKKSKPQDNSRIDKIEETVNGLDEKINKLLEKIGGK